MSGAIARRRCGRLGLDLPAAGLGCWSFGGGEYWGRQEQKDADAVVRSALAGGIDYFDTAEAYNDGRSELSLGRALAGLPRESFLVGTKVSPAHCAPGALERHCEASLRRLALDHVDLYMIHWPIHAHAIRHFTSDPRALADIPRTGDVLEALERLKAQGKIRAIGVSNYSDRRIAADLAGARSVVANQLPYNLLCRAIEFGTLDACAERGIGVIGYMTLLQGLLTGKYAALAEVPPWQRRTRHFDAARSALARHGGPGFEALTQRALDDLRALAAETGLSMTALALGWAMARPGIACALVGARDVRQLDANLAALQTVPDAATLARLDAITAPLKAAMGPHLDYYERPEDDRTV